MFDSEKFISLVEKQKPIYDVHSKKYSDKQLKVKCWDAVAEGMFENWHSMSIAEKHNTGRELLKKWRTLRDNFVRDFRIFDSVQTGKSTNKKKKYVYYDQLSFLRPYVTGNNNKSIPVKKGSGQNNKDASGSESDNQEQIPATSIVSQKRVLQRRAKIHTDISLASPSKTTTNHFTHDCCLHEKGENSDKFGNKAFLLSFLPTMDTLPPHAAFDVRMQITEVFRNAVINYYNPPECDQVSVQNSEASAQQSYGEN